MSKHIPVRFTLLATLVATTLAITAFAIGTAQAKGAVCDHVQPDLFHIDGMVQDWEGFSQTSYGSGTDAALRLRCAYDAHKLYIALQVLDERVIRSARPGSRFEDQLRVSLNAASSKAIVFSVFPGSERVPRRVVGAPSFVKIGDSLQERGFSIEMSIPLGKIEGWSASLPYLNGLIVFLDTDSPSAKKAQSQVGLRGKLHFSEAASTYRAFMKAVGLSNSDVRLDVLADVDPGEGAERIIVAGTVLGVLGTSYSYMGLPIASASDLLSAKVVDFDGSGRSLVLTELRQHGNGGSRDVLIAWSAKGDGRFVPVLTVETRKERAGSHIQNTWKLVPRGKYRQSAGAKRRRKRAQMGFDLLVQLGEVVGFSQGTFREAPASDAKSILTPWAEQQSAVYYFEGSVAYGGQVASHL